MQYKKLKLAINRGNRMVYLVSMASKACGLEEHVEVKKLYEKDLTLKGRRLLHDNPRAFCLR